MTNDLNALRHAARFAALALSLSAAAGAQDKAADKADVLTIGSDAPVPAIEKFVRGTEPKWFDGGKVYVVEFWATWCGPCRMSMPHISDVADKYKDKVVVVGISDEKVDTVTKFLDTDEWKQKARYNLATDPDRSVHKAYMEAAGQNGIPTAFIVKDSKVQWIGHPMGMDEPLEKIVAGTWDAASFKSEFEQQAAMERKQMQRRSAMAKARKSGDWDAVMKMLDEDIASAPARAKAGMQVQKFKMLLTDANRPADGYALGREVLAAAKGDKMVLNEMAWFVLDEERVKERDIPFALETAKAAVTASGGDDAAIIDTLARAWWESGDKAKAIEWQKKAIDKADGQMAGELKDTLRKYEGGEAPTPTKKTALLLQDGVPAAPAATAAPAAPKAPQVPGAAPGAPGAPRTPRMPRPEAKLTPAAEKVFPAITPEGFDSPQAMVEFLPTASKDGAGLSRLVRAMRSTTDGGKVALRVTCALIEDMGPLVTASMAKFGTSAANAPLPIPMDGKFEVKMDGEDKATLVGVDAEGKPSGKSAPLVKADGKWWLDFDTATGMRGDEGAQMAMMANMMGDTMRSSMKNAATGVAKDINDGKITSSEAAKAAFSEAVQRAMQESMGMGGPGAGAPRSRPATGGKDPAPGAPSAPAGGGAGSPGGK
jgi:thiol-disulfide isomerase/thioredoxin